MAKQKKITYHSRKFLNKKEGRASIEINASSDIWAMNGDVGINDCYKTITLEFNIYDKEDAANKLFKLNTFIDELTKYRDWMVLETPMFLERRDARTKKEKEEEKNRKLALLPLGLEEMIDD